MCIWRCSVSGSEKVNVVVTIYVSEGYRSTYAKPNIGGRTCIGSDLDTIIAKPDDCFLVVGNNLQRVAVDVRHAGLEHGNIAS